MNQVSFIQRKTDIPFSFPIFLLIFIYCSDIMGRQIYPRFLETLRRGNFLEVINSREQNSSMIGDWQAWHILLNLHNNSFGTHTGTKGIKFHPMITPISLRSG